MKPVGIVLLLFVFSLPKGQSIKCHVCQAHNSKHCEGKVTECPEGSSCMTVCERFTLNHTWYSFQRRCSMNMNCTANTHGFANDELNYEISYECCHTDLCNNGTFKMPNKTSGNNGPECPTCVLYNTSQDMCEPVSSTICKESTDRCAFLIGVLRKPDDTITNISGQGCTSYDSCNLDFTQGIGYSMDKIGTWKCWPQNLTQMGNMKPNDPQMEEEPSATS